MVASVYDDDKEVGGRPHTDEVVLVKCMLLQSWYGLSDPELEFQINDRLSFRNFLDFPDTIPDFTTIWKARERLKNTEKDKAIWKEVQRQLNSKGYKVKKGVIQDATFIESDIGRKRHYKEKQAKKKGKTIKYTDNQKNHIDEDASFTVKGGQVHHGYKSHIKMDIDYQFIRAYEVTTARDQDVTVDLVEDGDHVVYRDKAYWNKPLKAKNVVSMTMKRPARWKTLTRKELQRNKSISKIRAMGERPHAVKKRVFRGGRIYVKMLRRVSTKEMFNCFAYNLYQLVTLRRKQIAGAI